MGVFSGSASRGPRPWAVQAHFFFVVVVSRVQELIERTVQGMGYELVELEFGGGGLMRVFIDRLEAEPIRMEDCERVSHQLTHLLTVENIDYARLEVSSPGLDRPLNKPSDYLRFEGSEITLKLRVAFKGRRNFTGVLLRDPDLEGGFALDLTEPPATPPGGKGKARPAARAGAKAVKAGKSNARSTAPVADDPAASIQTGAPAPAAAFAGAAPSSEATAAEQTVRRLSFTLDEVDRARLVPKVKF